MKFRHLLLIGSLSIYSSVSYSVVYKCQDSSGKIAFQDKPCPANKASTELNISSGKNKSQTTTNDKPWGRWVNAERSVLTAYNSQAGVFEMSDKTGAKLKGKWSTKSDGSYSVEATFKGYDFPVVMRYDEQTDVLYLSKPAMPSSFYQYRRQ